MKKILSLVLIMTVILCGVFIFFEPQMTKAWGPGAGPYSDPVVVTQTVTEEISLSEPADISMSASILGMTGNPGSPTTGSATWNVKTSNDTGFKLELEASTDPALQLDASNQFIDYTPAGAVPDYTWTSPTASQAEFGFSVEAETGADVDDSFKDATSTCGSGTQSVGHCWRDFTGATKIEIINRSTETDSTGEDEVVKFQAESNAKQLSEGSYTATITATATMN